MSDNGPVQAPGGFVPSAAMSFGSAGSVATAVDPAHPLPVANRGVAVIETDRSAAIVAGGTAQVLAPANPTRGGFWIQNLSGADLWISGVGPAVAAAPALRIGAGQLYEAPAHGLPAGALSVLGATTGQSFSAREW